MIIRKKNIISILLFTYIISPFRIGENILSNFLSLPLALLVSVSIILVVNKFDLKIFLWGLLFSIFFYISLVINLNDHQKLLIKDYAEVLKPIFNALFINAGFNIGFIISNDQLKKNLIKFFIISIIFSSLVFFPPFIPLMNLYKGRIYAEDWSIVHYLRFNGFFGYPSIFGLWLVLGLLLIYLETNKKKIIYFLFFLYGLIFTASRTALIIFVLSVFVSFLLFDIRFFKIKISKRVLKYGTLIILLFVLSFIIINSSNFRPFELYLSFFEKGIGEGSLGYRVNELNSIFENFLFFGYGPNNYYLTNYHGPVESMYFYYTYKFGFCGILYIISIIYLLFKLLIKIKDNVLSKSFCLWSILTIIIGGISESIIDEHKSFFIFFIILGFVYKKYKDSLNNFNIQQKYIVG